MWMRIGLIYLGAIFVTSVANWNNPEEKLNKVTKTLDIGDEAQACNILKNSLVLIENDTEVLREADKERIRRLIREDDAFADAVYDYPELLTPMLTDEEWGNRADAISQAFWEAAKVAGLDSTLGIKLDDAGETWHRRKITNQTPPGKTKGRLVGEQIDLEKRLAKDTPFIREKCGISEYLLP